MEKKLKETEIKVLLNKILVLLYIICALFVVNIVINIVEVNYSVSNMSKKVDETNNNEDEVPEYDVSEFSEVDYSGLKDVINKKGTQVIYIGRETCGYCAMFIPIMKEAQEEYGFKTYYFDITRVFNYTNNSVVDQTAYNDLSEYNDFFKENFLATPMVVIFKDGKFVNGTMGYQEYNAYKAFLEDNGITK